MASAPLANSELLIRGNAESELEETLRTVGRHLINISTNQLRTIFLDLCFLHSIT